MFSFSSHSYPPTVVRISPNASSIPNKATKLTAINWSLFYPKAIYIRAVFVRWCLSAELVLAITLSAHRGAVSIRYQWNWYKRHVNTRLRARSAWIFVTADNRTWPIRRIRPGTLDLVEFSPLDLISRECRRKFLPPLLCSFKPRQERKARGPGEQSTLIRDILCAYGSIYCELSRRK